MLTPAFAVAIATLRIWHRRQILFTFSCLAIRISASLTGVFIRDADVAPIALRLPLALRFIRRIRRRTSRARTRQNDRNRLLCRTRSRRRLRSHNRRRDRNPVHLPQVIITASLLRQTNCAFKGVERDGTSAEIFTGAKMFRGDVFL